MTPSELDALVDAYGAPLVTDLPDTPDQQLVTFVWRADDPVDGVYVMANRLTDKDNVERGMMHREPDSDLWSVELTVPRGTMAGYSLFPFRNGDPALVDGAVAYRRELAARAVADPRSHDTRDGLPFGSLLRTAGSPSLDLWLPGPTGAASNVDDFDVTDADGDVHHVRVATTGPDPRDVLVLLDADKWFNRFDVVGAAGRAVQAGLMEPLMIVGIDAPPTTARRLAQLGTNETFVRAVAFDAVPRAVSLLPGEPRRTMLAGQSLGGLSALCTAAWCPGVFDTILAYSPSVWWRPGLSARPADVSARVDWIHDLATTFPAATTSLALAVGANETELRPNVVDLAQTLSANAIDHTLQLFPGGHDYPWWAHLLFDQLSINRQLPFEVHS